ncbi:patatin-like phospholipase family protein [Isoalcanivorax indicus]|uniref:patatin-like phospholipase family protein n=1 Tax=Isoalcanivorax indicus TaxID=2202653 RepID=UPI001FE971EC|nr:patatin-like phospholipase family protein [Isoalcanivorax indicus]
MAFDGWRTRPPQVPQHRALILSGGGARAAYQVGVLRAVAELLPRGTPNPFPIICGTSAGAINAAGLAANTGNYRLAVRGLERIWANLTAEQIYRTDLMAFIRSLLRWALPTWLTGNTPVNSALLDSRPLRRLLSLVINFRHIEQAIARGELHALSITASSYATGESVAFFQAAAEVEEWARARRKGRRTRIDLEHLLASSAIPLLFPAQSVSGSYYGDGAVRQLAPLSPALHLGASKLLVIGVSGNVSADHQRHLNAYPSMAQVLGHVLNSVFVDTLEGDVERLERINSTVAALPRGVRDKHDIALREVEVLKIYPSQPIDEIAAAHIGELPRTLRFFLRGSGGTRSAGAAAVSYLLFEPGFCRELMALGHRDALARADEIRAFFEISGSVASEPLDQRG